MKSVLFLYTDGGPDHTKMFSVLLGTYCIGSESAYPGLRGLLSFKNKDHKYFTNPSQM